MTVTNKQIKKIRKEFFSDPESGAGKNESVWNKLETAWNWFVEMKDEEMSYFFNTVVTYKEMRDSVKYKYGLACYDILWFLNRRGYSDVNYKIWKKQINLAWFRNKNNKTNNRDNSLNEYKAELEESIDLIEQEIEKHRQEKEKHGQEEERLSEQLLAKIAELDNIKYSQKRHKKFLNH